MNECIKDSWYKKKQQEYGSFRTKENQQPGFPWPNIGPEILNLFGLVLELSGLIQETKNMVFYLASLLTQNNILMEHGTDTHSLRKQYV